MLSHMADKIANAEDKIKWEIVCALADRIVVETDVQGKKARPLASVRYVSPR